jgi:DNA replicative helicase MCM subunit Mcm2 (Cdc46/Mcm family)
MNKMRKSNVCETTISGSQKASEFQKALTRVREKGMIGTKKEVVEEMKKNTYKCPRCKKIIDRRKAKVSEGYFTACNECDEDFYEFELVREERKYEKRKIIRETL